MRGGWDHTSGPHMEKLPLLLGRLGAMAGALSLGDSLSHWKHRAGHRERSLRIAGGGRADGAREGCGSPRGTASQGGSAGRRAQGPRGRLQPPGRALPRAGRLHGSVAGCGPWSRFRSAPCPWASGRSPGSCAGGRARAPRVGGRERCDGHGIDIEPWASSEATCPRSQGDMVSAASPLPASVSCPARGQPGPFMGRRQNKTGQDTKCFQ